MTAALQLTTQLLVNTVSAVTAAVLAVTAEHCFSSQRLACFDQHLVCCMAQICMIHLQA
jgi:hypothetical protein